MVNTRYHAFVKTHRTLNTGGHWCKLEKSFRSFGDARIEDIRWWKQHKWIINLWNNFIEGDGVKDADTIDVEDSASKIKGKRNCI